MNLNTHTHLLIILSSCFLVSCIDERLVPPPNRCEQNTDCNSNLVCLSKLCLKPNPENRRLAIRINPQSSNNFSTQYLTPGWLNLDQTLDIGLQPVVTVTGHITQGEKTTASNGKLIFSPFDGDLRASVTANLQADGRYTASLFPGKYRIRILPQSSDIPPFEWSERDITANSTIDLSLPPPSQIESVTLATNLPPGFYFGNVASDLLAARLFAYSTNKKLKTSTLTRIVPSSNDSDNPTVTLKIYASPTPYTVRIEPATPHSLVPFRVFENAFKCNPNCRSLIVGDSGAKTVSLRFALPLQQAKNLRIQFHLPANFRKEPLQDLKVILRRSDSGETSNIELTPNRDGLAVARAVEGKYTVIVHASTVSRIASRKYENVNLTASATASINLESKVLIHGTVESFDDSRVSNSRIEFHRRSGETINAREREVVVATTSPQGEFNVWLARGNYFMLVVPGEATTPRLLTRLSTLSDNEKTWKLDKPVLLQGQLYNAEQPTEHLRISANIEVIEVADFRRFVVGTTQTDDKGRFRVVVSDVSHL